VHAVHGGLHRKQKPLAAREACELRAQIFQKRRDMEVGDIGFDGAGLELADVEQGIQQARHGADREFLLFQRIAGIRVVHQTSQGAVQQAEGLQRLAQVVTRRREEAALGEIRAIGFRARFLQLALHPHALRDIPDCGGDQ
jgi:hypothetical protein